MVLANFLNPRDIQPLFSATRDIKFEVLEDWYFFQEIYISNATRF